MAESWHGTHNGYSNHRCRCILCKGAKSAYDANWCIINADKVLASKKKYQFRNASKILTRSKKYYADNTEKVKSYQSGWKKRNPDKVLSTCAKRRAAKSNLLVEPVSRAVVWDRDDGMCHICGQPANRNNWHLEHIIPLSRGGEHSYDNTAVRHPRCNLSKGAKRL